MGIGPCPVGTDGCPRHTQVKLLLRVHAARWWGACWQEVLWRTDAPRAASVLKQGVKELVYNGDKDTICNWIGE